jgi:hypothetical protein
LKLKEKVKIMGNKKFNLTKLALAVGVTVGLAGCFSDNDNNVDIKPTPKKETQEVVQAPDAVAKQSGSFSVSVVDSEGAPLPADTSATITFTNSTDGLLKADGGALTEDDAYFTTTNGTFAFAVDGLSSEETTYEFTVSSADYIANNAEVTLTTGDTLSVAVKLTNRNFSSENTPVVSQVKTLDALAADNKDVASATYSAEDGLVILGDDGKAASVTLRSKIPEAQAAKAVGEAAVTMASGIQFVGENDEVLTSTPTLTVAYYANEASAVEASTENTAADDTSSLDAFPGGLNLEVAGEAGETSSGNFTSGGFVAIELRTEDNQVVKSFGEDDAGNKNTIKVAMKVDQNTKTPCPVMIADGESLADAAKRGFTQKDANNQGGGVCLASAAVDEPVKLEVGHVFPIWSYEESNGQWSFEQFGEVISNGSEDTFDVVVDVDHLSYWNLDFFVQQGCSRTSFKIVNADGSPSDRYASVQLLSNSYRFERAPWNRASLDEVTLARAPSFNVELRIMENGVNILDGVVGEAGANDNTAAAWEGQICDLNNKTLQLVAEEAVEVSNVTVTPVARCSNNNADGVVAAPDVPSSVIVDLYRGETLNIANKLNTFYDNSSFSVELNQEQAYTFAYVNPFSGELETRNITPDAATGELTLDMPLECDVQTVEVTGTGAGS